MRGSPVWVTAFVDLPADRFDPGVAFWRGVTGYGLSAPRGDTAELATLDPPDGVAHLRVQRVSDGPGGVHLDLHRVHRELEVHTSPGGLPWCDVPFETPRPSAPQGPPERAGVPGVPTAPATWPGGHRSIVDQVCIDAPAAHFDAEVAFWAEQTGWVQRASSVSTSFSALVRPEGQPVKILLQRVDDDRPHTTAHLDLATDDRAAETARHEALGATVRTVNPVWTVMTDPTGAAYCITDRDPTTGVLG